MSEGFEDPGAPPEGGKSLKAADLLNKPLLLRPTGVGMWDAKPATPAEYDEAGNVVKEAQEAQEASPYIVCDVWVLDRAGVIDEGTGVRFSWWKVVKQLEEKQGRFVGGVPVVEQGGKARIFVPLDEAHKKVAAQVVKDIHDERPM